MVHPDAKDPNWWDNAKAWIGGVLILLLIFGLGAMCSVIDPSYLG